MANIASAIRKAMLSFGSTSVKGITPTQELYLIELRSLAIRCSEISEGIKISGTYAEHDLLEISGKIDEILYRESYNDREAEWINELKPLYIVLKKLDTVVRSRI